MPGLPRSGALDRLLKIGEKAPEGSFYSAPSTDQHIIMAAPRRHRGDTPHRLAQAPANAIAHRGNADLVGDGKAEARRRLVVGRALADLKREMFRVPPAAARGFEKIGPLLEALKAVHRVAGISNQFSTVRFPIAVN
jgi:hypothetical protein